jgi:sec-independent protein translocase protein TatA
MHAPGIWSLLIVLLLAFVLFGRPGRISGLMEDLGKGIKGFRKGLGDVEANKASPEAPAEPPRQITQASETTAARDKTEA